MAALMVVQLGDVSETSLGKFLARGARDDEVSTTSLDEPLVERGNFEIRDRVLQSKNDAIFTGLQLYVSCIL